MIGGMEMERDTLRILLIDDDEDDYFLVCELLSEVRNVQLLIDWKEGYASGLEALLTGGYDACLLDYRLDSQDGLTFLREAMGRGCDTAIIMLTGFGDEHVDLEAMRAGAADYLVKTLLSRELLERSIRYSVERASSAKALQRRREELAHVARVATMGELASSVAHELAQPLTAVLSNARAGLRFLDRETPDMEEIRSALENIAEDAARAGQVIKNLRSLFKRQETERSRLDVNALILGTLRLVASDCNQKKIILETDLAPDLPTILGDQVQLQQVLLNLLLNALDSIPPESVLRKVCICTTIGSGFVRIAVVDTGSGVAAENMGCIFNSFFTTKPEGLGMGLPISRYIIEAHCGRLWAEKNDGCGMTFCLSLPVEA